MHTKDIRIPLRECTIFNREGIQGAETDSMAEKYQFETRCIHGDGGFVEEHPYGAVSVPIFQTATFAHPGIGKSTGYDYSRESNPTRYELESVMSSLEGADDSIACSTGMAAIGICLELFGEGDHILCTEDLYGGTVRMFESIGEKRGLKFSYVDTSDIDLVKKISGKRQRHFISRHQVIRR